MKNKKTIISLTIVFSVASSLLAFSLLEKSLRFLNASTNSFTMTFDDKNNPFPYTSESTGNYNFKVDSGNIVPFAYTNMKKINDVNLYWKAGGVFYNVEEIRSISKIEIAGTYLASFDLEWGFDKYDGEIYYEESAKNAFTFTNTDADTSKTPHVFNFENKTPNYIKLTQTSDQWGGRGLFSMKIYYSSACSRSEGYKEPYKQYRKNSRSKEFAKMGYKNLVNDELFKTGFKISKADATIPYIYNKPIMSFDNSNWGILPSPAWQFTQWQSDNLVNPDEDKFYFYRDGSKHIIRDKEIDYAKSLEYDCMTGEFLMECDARKEYLKEYSNEGWLHFLLEQGWPLEHCAHVVSCSSIVPTLDFEVTKLEEDSNMISTRPYASTFVYYLIVQNLNRNSPGYGKFIWVGFDVFDNRTIGSIIPETHFLDKGTNAMIVKPSSEYCLSNGGKIPQLNQKTSLQCTFLRSYLEDVYYSDASIEFRKTTNFDDLYVAGFNFGYEVHNKYDTCLKLSNFGIYYK